MKASREHRTSGTLGGQAGIRGYLVQTLVTLIDVTLNETFKSVTMEPGHLSDKFDILWEDEFGVHAVQVKSTCGEFTRTAVCQWVSELETTCGATDLTLSLIGLIPRSLAKVSAIGRVRIERKNLDLVALREQAAHRLDRFLSAQCLPTGTPQYREMLVDALTARLFSISTSGSRFHRSEFVDQMLFWIQGVRVPSDLREVDIVLKQARVRIMSQLESSHISLKYKTSYYIQRTLEVEIEEWLGSAPGERSACFLVLSPAGCGKTNILSSIVRKSVEVRPTFFVTGGQLRLDERLGLWSVLAEVLRAETSHFQERGAVIDAVRRITSASDGGALMVFDAINEYNEPVRLRRELRLFLEEAKETRISVLISCRDYYWGLFEGEFWDEFVRPDAKRGKVSKRTLGNFCPSEASLAFAKYFPAYNISVRPEGNAREQLRHPLLLRFFCETHEGRKMGLLRDVRLKELFDKYWKAKLNSIAERMLGQGMIGTLAELKERVGSCLLNIAGNMLNGNVRAIPLASALKIMCSAESSYKLLAPYGRILDEHIILEELTEHRSKTLTLVAFVFEEFMEYTMARFLVCEWADLDTAGIAKEVVELTGKYSAFSQVFGVVLYSGLMLKAERGLALWPALIGLGATWERVVLEAFKKLSEEQIDETVFDALIDLLRVPRTEIQIETLELLKFRRLRRILPAELVRTVGDLALAADLRVRRRALIALATCPAELAVPLIERAVKQPIRLLEDQYVITRQGIYALSQLATPGAVRVLALIVAGYWSTRVPQLPEELLFATSKELSKDSDVMVRVGLVKLLRASRCRAALPVIEEMMSDFSRNPNSWCCILPRWVRDGGICSSKSLVGWYYPNGWRSEAQATVTQSYFVDAIRDLEKALGAMDEQIAFDVALKRALSQPFGVGPSDGIRELMEMSGFLRNKRVRLIIKGGLEARSSRKWAVTGTGRTIRIMSTSKHRSDGTMTEEDAALLGDLLALPERPSRRGVEITEGGRWSGYWKEYIFRAWGAPPEVTGIFDPWD